MTQALHTKNTVPTASAAFLEDLATFLREEDAERFADMFVAFVAAGGTHATGAGLTKTPDALTAYVGGRLVAETGSIVYPDNDTGWVIAHKDLTGNVGTFTRVTGTHYLIDFASASKPALPADAVWLMEVVTSGGSVTTVTDLRPRVPHVDVVDNQAALPAAGRRGRLAYTRSENRLWFDSGTAWVALIDDAELAAARDGEANLAARLDDFEVLAKLTNRTGAPLAANDVAAVSAADDTSAVLENVQGSAQPFVVAHETVANLAVGRFRLYGKTTVKVNGAVTRGNYLRKSATSLALEDAGVAGTATAPSGALAIALTSAAGPGLGTVTAFFLGPRRAALSLPAPGANRTILEIAAGQPAYANRGLGLKSVQVITASGTWTRPTDIRKVLVEVVGGGGGGGGGGTGTGSGGTGLTSSFGTHCSATGGAGGNHGGSSPPRTGGDGGVGSGGDINAKGSGGASGGPTTGNGGGVGGDSPRGGGGGVTPAGALAGGAYGGGGAGGGLTGEAAGGGGGGGGYAAKLIDVTGITSETVTVGAGGVAGAGTLGAGAGAAGVVIVWEFE